MKTIYRTFEPASNATPTLLLEWHRPPACEHQTQQTSDTNPASESPHQFPGTHQWTDRHYQRFVQLYSQGSFPEVQGDPTAWDKHYTPAGDPNHPDRPTLISPADFQTHLPTSLQSGHGLLLLKLWEIASHKGYTHALHHQSDIQKPKATIPTPEPRPLIDPRRQWYDHILATATDATNPTEIVKHVQRAVIEGQPYRNAALAPHTDSPAPETIGTTMLPDSVDALADPTEPPYPEPPIPKWSPDATTAQIVNGAARDLADLVSTLIARQRVAIGYAADQATISQTIKLAHSLRQLTQTMHTTELTTQAKKRGRPRKLRCPSSENNEK